ncbi:hypothetical protein [Streptomyces sp. NPDC058157]|uniref:hypothetical protein n=1 Tax=Streptomyces sp. NPDC058157 TaxID=3346360 RepID=UPI0036E0CBD9
MGQKAVTEGEPGAPGGDGRERRKLDLSATQVAGSSLATVAAALLASKLGVYGTILGAGVVSVVATAGGPVIQHAFRRTGDRLRAGARNGAPGEAPGPLPQGEFGEATVHGTRVRGWKRTAVASGAAFALAIGGLGTYEAFAGTSVSSGGGTLWSGGTRKAPDHRSSDQEKGPDSGDRSRRGGQDGKGAGDRTKDGTGGRSPDPGSSPSPSASHGGPDPTPTPTPSGSPRPDPSPTPSRQTPGPDPAPSTGGGTGAPGGSGTTGRE